MRVVVIIIVVQYIVNHRGTRWRQCREFSRHALLQAKVPVSQEANDRPKLAGNFSDMNLKNLAFLLGDRCRWAATCTIGPTISSSPSCGNLPPLLGSLSDGILVMMLAGDPILICFNVKNASPVPQFSTVCAMVLSLFFFHSAST